MKNLFSFFAVLVLALTFAGTASAQNGVFAPYVDAGISVSSTLTGTGSLTARNPNYQVGGGIESSSKYLLLNFDGQFNSQNVRTFGFGPNASFTGTLTGTGFYKAGKHLLLGGGVKWSDQVTNGQISSLIPSSINQLAPLVGAGLEFSRDRFTVLYVLPGRNTTVNQREVDFHNELYITKSAHFRLTTDVTGSTGDVGVPILGLNNTIRISGGSAAVGIKFVL
jgi:hypothetical protein